MILPHAKDLEETVLGAILLEKTALDKVDFLTAEMFYDINHFTVFTAIKELQRANSAVDIVTLCSQLSKGDRLKTIGGAYFVSQLTSRVVSDSNLVFHARIIHQLYIKRKLITISDQMMRKCQEGQDVFDLIDWNNREIANLINAVEGGNLPQNIYQIGLEVISDTENNVENKLSGNQNGVPIRLTKLKEQLGAWQSGELIVLAARPGMGKTSAALDFCYYPALLGTPTAFFSLEMPSKQLTARILSLESSVSSKDMKRGELDNTELVRLKNGLNKLKNIPMYIDDSYSMTISKLRSKAVLMKNQYDIKLIVLDYLQLMAGDSKGNREQEISQITRGLKSLSKELELPIIALSQLSRAVDSRDDKMPVLSDLRESGSIEQDADIVMFLVRPDYYLLSSYEYCGEVVQGEEIKTLLIANIAKHRNGDTGQLRFMWHGKTTSIHDYNTSFIPESKSLSALQTNDDFLTNNN